MNIQVNKIRIKEISKEVHEQKGFPTGPFDLCLKCKCGELENGGACCDEGVYADKESYDLIIKHKEYLEDKIGVKIEDCFGKDWTEDNDFLGGNGIYTNIIDGSCIFRSRSNGGCEIVSTVITKNLPTRMIPSACRLYPLTWDKGVLRIEKIRKNCVCIDQRNDTQKSIYQTQNKEIDDIFHIS